MWFGLIAYVMYGMPSDRRVAGFASAVAQLVLVVAPVALALPVYHALRPRKRLIDGNTWCGQCGYLLKGLVEPRCPECGTRI